MTGSEVEKAGGLVLAKPPLPSEDEIERIVRLAKLLHASGVYKDVPEASKAFAKILVGRELGLSVPQSMQGVQFVKGNVQLHYSTLALCIKSRGFSWKTIERSETRAAATFFDADGNELDDVEFTMANADTAGLTEPSARTGAPSMYTKYPRNMLWARMMSDAVRFVIPEATGGIPVYVPGEIVPVAELTDGSDDAPPIELSPEIEEVIARAERLGHAGLANRATWAQRIARVDVSVSDLVAEASAELDGMEIPDATVVPDEKIFESLGGGEPGEVLPASPEPVTEEPAAAPAAQGRRKPAKKPAKKDEGPSIVELRNRLAWNESDAGRQHAKTREQEALRLGEIADLKEAIQRLAERSAAESAEQESLL